MFCHLEAAADVFMVRVGGGLAWGGVIRGRWRGGWLAGGGGSLVGAADECVEVLGAGWVGPKRRVRTSGARLWA